jgi:hypothetical protein
VAFRTEILVDEYGYLTGGEDTFPIDVTGHDFRKPYPLFDGDPAFTWEPGGRGETPDIFRHPEIRDWVCDDAAWSVLAAAGPDVRRLGGGHLGGRPLHVVQVVGLVTDVDPEASVRHDYGSYQVVEFPALRGGESAVRTRVFRVPDNYTSVFVGAAVKQALDDAGITGLSYAPLADGR